MFAEEEHGNTFETGTRSFGEMIFLVGGVEAEILLPCADSKHEVSITGDTQMKTIFGAERVGNR